MQQLPRMGGEDTYYDGSRIFSRLADMCGLSVDLVSLIYIIIIIKEKAFKELLTLLFCPITM